MAIDLNDLIDSLKREVSIPGAEETTFPDATTSIWLGSLKDGFWDARLDGLLPGYEVAADTIVPTSVGGADLSRDLQQLIVFYAGFRIIRNQLRTLRTVFRAKAGDVEYETQQAATQLTAILNELKDRRDRYLLLLAQSGQVSGYYVDMVCARGYDDYGVFHGSHGY